MPGPTSTWPSMAPPTPVRAAYGEVERVAWLRGIPCDIVDLARIAPGFRDPIEGRVRPKSPWDDIARELQAA